MSRRSIYIRIPEDKCVAKPPTGYWRPKYARYYAAGIRRVAADHYHLRLITTKAVLLVDQAAAERELENGAAGELAATEAAAAVDVMPETPVIAAKRKSKKLKQNAPD